MKNESNNIADVIAGILTGFVMWAVLAWMCGVVL
jgi:hypothetical protein